MHGREYSRVDGLIAEIKDSDCTIWRKKQKSSQGGEMHFFMCQELAGRIISQALEIKNDGDKKWVVSVLKEKLLLVEKQFHQSKWHELDEKDRKCFGVKQDYLDHFLEFTKNDRRLSMRMQYVFLGGAHAEPSRFVKQNYSRFLRHLGLVRKKRSSSDAFDSRMLSSFKMLHSISRGGGQSDRAMYEASRCGGDAVSPSSCSSSFLKSLLPVKKLDAANAKGVGKVSVPQD